jgi:bifunctional non-homologous end joining protein LigD
VIEALAALPDDIVLDAELVVPDTEGRSDFEELRRRVLQRPRAIAQAAHRTPAVLVAFDLLALNGEDLRQRPLSERRSVLDWYGLPAPLQVAECIETHGQALFREIARHHQEGIVAKRLDAPYPAGRQPTWLKIKNREYSRRAAVEWHPHALAGA